MQPTPVLSLGSDLWSQSLSSHGEQTSHWGWWVLVGTELLFRNLFTLPSALRLLCSPQWLQSYPPAHSPSPPVKGLHSLWKLFLLHSSLPEVQVLSLYFCLCFLYALKISIVQCIQHVSLEVEWRVDIWVWNLREASGLKYNERHWQIDGLYKYRNKWVY